MDNPQKLTLDTFFQNLPTRRRVDLSTLEDTAGLPPNFKATKAFDLIIDRIAYARRVRAPLALVTGAHGAGKTSAFKYYAHHEDVVYWECRAGYQAKHVLADIAEELAISTGQGWRTQTSIITEQLATYPRTFLLDEAQRLNYESLDLLKYIADNSGSTFILSASPSLEKRIDRWPDIASRCVVRVHVGAMELAEFFELYQADGFALEVLSEMHRLTKGVMRTLQHLITLIDEEIHEYNQRTRQHKGRGDLQVGHIRAIAQGVIG